MALQTGAYALEQDVPNKIIFSDSNYTSTSDASLNRRHTRFAPKNDTTFQPRGTREIEFQLSSQTSFLDVQNMYVTGKFLNRTRYSGALTSSSTAEDQFLAIIEEGGIDALFETVILENASTGATIQKIENYNTWCATHNLVYKDPNEASEVSCDEFDWSSSALFNNPTLDGVMGVDGYYREGTSTYKIPAGTSLAAYVSIPGDLIMDLNLTALEAATTIPLSTANQAAIVLRLLHSLQPGDVFQYSYIAATFLNTKQFRVVHVRNLPGVAATKTKRIIVENVLHHIATAAQTTTYGSATMADAPDFNGSDDFTFRIVSRGNGANWRIYVGSSMSPDGLGDSAAATTKETRGENLQFIWKPKLPFLWMKKYYPLFLHSSGWRLRCILDPNVYHSFYGIGSPSKDLALASLVFDYQITDVRMGIVVYDFHSSINKEYLDSYKSDKGLMFPFKGVHYSGSQTPPGAGSFSIQVTPGVRSARNVVTRMTTDEIYSSSTVASHFSPSLSAHPGLGLTSYQYASGSLVFPQRPIEFIDQFHMENRKHVMIQNKKSCDRHEMAIEGTEPHNAPAVQRLNPWNINEWGTTYYGKATGGVVYMFTDGKNNGLMTAVLSREMDGRFAGLDLSIQPLKLDMTFGKNLSSNITANRILHTFIYYDAYLHLAEASGVTTLS